MSIHILRSFISVAGGWPKLPDWNLHLQLRTLTYTHAKMKCAIESSIFFLASSISVAWGFTNSEQGPRSVPDFQRSNYNTFAIICTP